jgi:hypothetical protein
LLEPTLAGLGCGARLFQLHFGGVAWRHFHERLVLLHKLPGSDEHVTNPRFKRDRNRMRLARLRHDAAVGGELL